jgi:hypothetical protein
MKYIIILIILFYFLQFIIYKEKDDFQNDYNLPKVIYSYWDNYESNELIQAFINNFKKKLSKNWEIIIISNNNIHKYVSKDFINKYKNLEPFRFSDFLRLELLKNNGGCWIDMTTIIIDGSFMDKFHNEITKNKSDVLLFEYKVKTLDKKYPYLENWFIMAPKNSKYILDLYTEFDKANSIGYYNYINKILIPNNINLTNTLGYNGSTYLMQHAICHYLLKINKYNIIIKSAEESMFKVQDLNDWDNVKIINYIYNNLQSNLQNNNLLNLYAIKLVAKNRKGILDNNKFIKMLNNL